mmetsp:Transcript_21095/g.37833  ORF Transcript_21095/g.37833 Transcript_21095/m.37833 type:complete len:194 (-) Transcript_21095:266-847(-)
MSPSRLLLAILSLKYSSAGAADSALRGATPCELRRWHIDIDNVKTPGCSNSWRVPDSWHIPANAIHMFYASAAECCFDLYEDGACNIVSHCAPTIQEITNANEWCDNDPKWHNDFDVVNGCTNNPRYPDIWNGVDTYFHDTSEECCEKFVDQGSECNVEDFCEGLAGNQTEVIVSFEVPQNTTATEHQILFHV